MIRVEQESGVTASRICDRQHAGDGVNKGVLGPRAQLIRAEELQAVANVVALAYILDTLESLHVPGKVGLERALCVAGPDVVVGVLDADVRAGRGPGVQRLEPLGQDIALHVIGEKVHGRLQQAPLEAVLSDDRRCRIGFQRVEQHLARQADALKAILAGQRRQLGQRARDAQ